jgi:protein-tyrosine sulfotransferase
MAGSPLLGRVRNRVERARQHRWRMAPHRSPEAHIVLGGAPRSGTTLLRRLLDRHPEVCAGAETKLFVPAAFNLAWLAQSYAIPRPELDEMRRRAPSQAAFIDAFAGRVRGIAGKGRWAEKTPQNIRHLDWILEHFPVAAVVHIVRDGRDVVCSMREHPDWRWVDGAWQRVLVPRALGWYAQRWLEDTAAGMARRGDSRYAEVRYEDLVVDPRRALEALCERLGIAVDQDWLGEPGLLGGAMSTAGAAIVRATPEPGQGREGAIDGMARSGRPDYEGAVSAISVGRWRNDLSPAELAEVERICGPRLRQLGYEV